jgi:hypothetical protein
MKVDAVRHAGTSGGLVKAEESAHERRALGILRVDKVKTFKRACKRTTFLLGLTSTGNISGTIVLLLQLGNKADSKLRSWGLSRGFPTFRLEIGVVVPTINFVNLLGSESVNGSE